MTLLFQIVPTFLVPLVLSILILLHPQSIYITVLRHEILLKNLILTSRSESLPVLVFHHPILQLQTRRTVKTGIQGQVSPQTLADEQVAILRRLQLYLEQQ